MSYFSRLGMKRCQCRFLFAALAAILAQLMATVPNALAAERQSRSIPGMPCNGGDGMMIRGSRTIPGVGLTPKYAAGSKYDLSARLLQQTAPQPRTVPFDINGELSHVDFIFEHPPCEGAPGRCWWIATGSSYHHGDDAYAEDWNFGNTNDDEGMTVLSAFPGFVIFAGNNQVAWGNQVIVQSIDEPTFAMRYAHLYTVAQEMGDLVYFGSEIGTVGKSGGDYSPHLHMVLYKNIEQGNALERLRSGASPSGALTGEPTKYAARFLTDGDPTSGQCVEDLPCWTWNGDVNACNQHSILYGGKYTQDCAYYYCSNLCLPRGTSNCRAGCFEWCDKPEGAPPSSIHNDLDNDGDEYLPCHTWDNDLEGCDDHSILFGDEYTRDCAYYLGSDKCRPRGTSNCLAGIYGHCGEWGCQ